MLRTSALVMVIAGIILALLLAACQQTQSQEKVAGKPTIDNLSAHQVITVGDIDPDEPAKKLKRFQPLADYLAQHLESFGIHGGRVVPGDYVGPGEIGHPFSRDEDNTLEYVLQGRVAAGGISNEDYDEQFPEQLKEGIVAFGRTISVPRQLVDMLHNSSRNTALVARRDHGVITPADLRGRTIAVSKNTNGEFFIVRYVTSQGLQWSDITIVDTKPQAMVEALTEGSDDTIAT